MAPNCGRRVRGEYPCFCPVVLSSRNILKRAELPWVSQELFRSLPCPQPGGKIGKRPTAERLLAVLAADFLRFRQFGKQSKIDIHRLEAGGLRASGNVTEKRAQRGGRRRGRGFTGQCLGGGKTSGQQTDGSAFDITFDAGDLAGKAQVRRTFQPQ